MSLTVTSRSAELLHVSHCLPLLLAFSHCLFQFHRDSASLSLSPILAGCLSLSPLVLLSFCMSLTVSHFLSLLLAFSQFLSKFHGVETQPATVGDSKRHLATPLNER